MINRTYFIIFSLVFLYGASNNSIKSLIKTAKMHEKKDDYNSAISIYENLLKKDPYHRQSLRNLKSIFLDFFRRIWEPLILPTITILISSTLLIAIISWLKSKLRLEEEDI